MTAQPIDPRALRAAEEIGELTEAALVALNGPRLVFGEYHEQLARIIQSHFAESVNGKLLEALENLVEGFTPEADFEFHNPECPALFGTWKDCNCSSLKDWREAREAISLAQSQPPSMADELAEALRDYFKERDSSEYGHGMRAARRLEKLAQLLARYDAQKGQS